MADSILIGATALGTERPILEDPLDSDGHFTTPSEDFDVDDEVRWAKKRLDTVRVSQYADSKCGLPNTFDSAGAYLCGGRSDGSSSPCNKMILQSGECLIRIKPISDMHLQSCAFWEVKNSGDPEARYCPKGKLEDSRIGFGSTKNEEGFGCIRCEYGQNQMPRPDSEGRDRWCKLKGHPVERTACCEDNEPVEE